MTSKSSFSKVLPVLFGFFIMGFVDIVGAATHAIKDALGLSSFMAGLLPNFIFIWFLICAVPAGLMIRRFGRKTMVQVSNIVTLVGMLIPLPMLLGVMDLNLGVYLATFALLGIGNTIIQVALNPLLTNVVNKDRQPTFITFGQSVKAVSSLVGPLLITFCTTSLGHWDWTFVIYAGLTLLSMLWLGLTEIPREERATGKGVSFADTFALLKDSFLLRMFICIVIIVGIDVGMNCLIPEIFSKIYGYSQPQMFISIYFACRVISAFVCGMMLLKMSPRKVLLWTMVGAIAACVVMMLTLSSLPATIAPMVLFIVMFLPVTFATANVFSIVFSLSLAHLPQKTDQISSLLIMGVAGGGLMTLIMGFTDSVVGRLAILLVCMGYIFFVALSEARK